MPAAIVTGTDSGNAKAAAARLAKDGKGVGITIPPDEDDDAP